MDYSRLMLFLPISSRPIFLGGAVLFASDFPEALDCKKPKSFTRLLLENAGNVYADAGMSIEEIGIVEGKSIFQGEIHITRHHFFALRTFRYQTTCNIETVM